MSTKDFSSLQERTIAKYLDWRVVSGSGSRDFTPGDIECDEWLGECKTHMSRTSSIVFYSDVWRKISREAESKFKFPALFVDIGTQNINDTWVLFNFKTCRPYNSELISTSLVKIKTNIRFDSDDLRLYYRSVVKDTKTDKILVVSAPLDKQSLGIVPLTVFGDIVRKG